MTIRNDKLDARLIELAGDLPKLTQIARAAGVAAQHAPQLAGE